MPAKKPPRTPAQRSPEAQAVIDRLQKDYAALEDKYRGLLYGEMKTEEAQKQLIELRAGEVAAAVQAELVEARTAVAAAIAARDELRSMVRTLLVALAPSKQVDHSFAD